jgi:hypothetical protein
MIRSQEGTKEMPNPKYVPGIVVPSLLQMNNFLFHTLRPKLGDTNKKTASHLDSMLLKNKKLEVAFNARPEETFRQEFYDKNEDHRLEQEELQLAREKLTEDQHVFKLEREKFRIEKQAFQLEIEKFRLEQQAFQIEIEKFHFEQNTFHRKSEKNVKELRNKITEQSADLEWFKGLSTLSQN